MDSEIPDAKTHSVRVKHAGFKYLTRLLCYYGLLLFPLQRSYICLCSWINECTLTVMMFTCFCHIDNISNNIWRSGWRQHPCGLTHYLNFFVMTHTFKLGDIVIFGNEMIIVVLKGKLSFSFLKSFSCRRNSKALVAPTRCTSSLVCLNYRKWKWVSKTVWRWKCAQCAKQSSPLFVEIEEDQKHRCVFTQCKWCEYTPEKSQKLEI